MKQYVIIFILTLLACACKPTKFTLEDSVGKRITIGNAGGFTGQAIEYTLFENGQVFKFNSLNKQTMELDKLDKDIALQIFSSYDFLNLGEASLNLPGNMNYYIIMYDEKTTKKLLWNDNDKDSIDKNIRLFYLTTLNKVKSNSTKQ